MFYKKQSNEYWKSFDSKSLLGKERLATFVRLVSNLIFSSSFTICKKQILTDQRSSDDARMCKISRVMKDAMIVI